MMDAQKINMQNYKRRGDERTENEFDYVIMSILGFLIVENN